jgi:Tol biopolymer transport system component
VVVAVLAGSAAMAALPALPPPVSVGPVEVKAVRWLAEGYNPVWASDGSFFVASRAEAGFFRYASDGSKETRLGKNTEAFCDLSPDGKSMLYCQISIRTVVTKTGLRYHTRDPKGVGLMKADGTGRRVVNKTAAYANWSPDGRYFACQNQLEYRPEGPVHIYDRGGKLVRRIEYAMGPPAWSGDGQYLAYVGKAGEICLAQGNGSSPKVPDQPTGGERYAHLWWSPKGHNLLYAWRTERHGREQGALCHLAPGSRPIEICDAFSAVMWSPSGDRAVAADSPGRLTVFAFPKGKDPEVLLTREHGGPFYLPVCWHGDGRSLLYAAQDGLWLPAAESEEDRALGHPRRLYPLAALPGSSAVFCVDQGERGAEETSNRLWLLDTKTGKSASFASKANLVGRDLLPVVWVSRSGRAAIYSMESGQYRKLLVFRITRRT